MSGELCTLATDELTHLIDKRIDNDGKPQDDYTYMLDSWFWAFKGDYRLNNLEAVPFDQVPENVDRLLNQGLRLACWSGGFDLGYHSNTICTLPLYLPEDVLVVAGIESDAYIRGKGREPQFDQMARLSAVGLMLRNVGKLGFVFPIPERGNEDPTAFYDRLVKEAGLFRRPGCYHLYDPDDPAKAIKIARMLNPEPWCCLQLIKALDGRPYSTSRLLGLEV